MKNKIGHLRQLFGDKINHQNKFLLYSKCTKKEAYFVDPERLGTN